MVTVMTLLKAASFKNVLNSLHDRYLQPGTAQKMKFSTKDFFSKYPANTQR